MGFGPNLYDFARRPDDPILVIQHPKENDASAEIEAARTMFSRYIVIGYAGTDPHRSDALALSGRDVVVWPWQTPGNRRDVLPLLDAFANGADRLRVVKPEDPMDMMGPADLQRRMNCSGDSTDWVRRRLVDVQPTLAERPPLVADYRPNGYQPHPDMLEDDPCTERYANTETPMYDDQGDEWPEPVDLFTKRALPPFKAEFLPDGISDYVLDQSEIIGADPSMLGVCVLVAAAACLHDGIKLQAQRYNAGWRESARVWGMCIGDPSKRKTPVISAATSQLVGLDFKLRSQSADELKSYAKQMRSFEALERNADRKQAAGKMTGYLGDPPMKPPLRALVVQDITPEKYAVLCNDNPGGLLVLRDELSGFIGGMDAYSNGGKKDGPFWLQAYNGGPWSVDRITRDSLLVTNLSACVLGGIQPSRLADLARQLPDDGLLQRFMPVIAQDVDGIGYDRAPLSAGVDAWRSCIEWLSQERPRPEPVLMSDGALRVREAFERSILDLQRAHAGQTRLVAHLGKWSGLFVRLCLVHHAMECAIRAEPVRSDVGGATARRVARYLLDYLYEHARAMYDDLEGDTGIHVDARWIAGHIVGHKLESITLRRLYRSYHRFKGMDDRKRAPVMRAMEYSGWLVPVRSRGETTQWNVNPRVHQLFAHHAQPELDARATAREILIARRTAAAEAKS